MFWPSQEANKKHSVNGYILCNMPDIVVPEGSKLRLILIGVGGEDDMHTPGFTDLIQNTPSGSSYVVELYPGAAHVVSMYAGEPPSSSSLCLLEFRGVHSGRVDMARIGWCAAFPPTYNVTCL